MTTSTLDKVCATLAEGDSPPDMSNVALAEGDVALARRRGFQGTDRRAARNKLIEVIVVLAFLAIMLTFMLPWATDNLVNGFLNQMRTP